MDRGTEAGSEGRDDGKAPKTQRTAHGASFLKLPPATAAYDATPLLPHLTSC